mgnify:CR=1 FL=1
MNQYLGVMEYIMNNGEDVSDRTGVGTRTIFGQQMRFNLQDGFPAVTTKRLAWKSVVSELLWFLEGSEDERRLAEITFEKPREELRDKKTIWTANADKQGVELGYANGPEQKNLGPVYGVQWRNFNQVGIADQISEIIDQIRNTPDSRRIILTAWNPLQIPEMALPPCHTMSQFRVINGKLSCQLYCRSQDLPLGTPFNIASYALLTHMFAQICGLGVGDFVWTGGDCHIYHNQFDGVREQIQREPKPLPTLKMPAFGSLRELLETKPSQYTLEGYEHHPTINFPFAV